MPEDIKLPGLGRVDKKWVLIGGAGALGLIAVIVIRRKSAGQNAAGTDTTGTSGTSGTDSGIDPATGLPYASEGGSSGIDPATGIPYAEESAGYGAMGSYGGNGSVGIASNYDAAGYPIGSEADLQWQSGQSGGTTGGSSSGSITTKQDWIDQAESGIVPGSQSAIAEAMAKVFGGLSVTSAQRNLFLEAVGILGDPPGGYPKPIKLKDTPAHPAPGGGGHGGHGGGHGQHTKEIRADGKDTVSQIAHEHGTTGGHLLALNPFLHQWYPGNKHVPRGEKIKVPA